MKKGYTKDLKKYNKDLNEFVKSDDFVWFDYSSLLNFLLLYLKNTSQMYKKYGVSKESSNIIPETMEKAYKMLRYAYDYEDEQLMRHLDNDELLIDEVRKGNIFRPGKTGSERVLDLKRQIHRTYIYTFNYIGKHIMKWWD